MSVNISKVKEVIEKSVFAERIYNVGLGSGGSKKQLNSELIHSGAIIADQPQQVAVKLVACWMRGEI